MARTGAAGRPFIPGERSSMRSAVRPNYSGLHSFGVFDMVPMNAASKTNEKRKQKSDHLPDAVPEFPVKRIRKSMSKETATTPTLKPKTTADRIHKTASKPKSAAKGLNSQPKVNYQQSVAEMTGSHASGSAVFNFALDPDEHKTGKLAAKRGLESIHKTATRRPSTMPTRRATRSTVDEVVSHTQQDTISSKEAANRNDSMSLEESEPSPGGSSLSNITVAGGGKNRPPTLESSNNAPSFEANKDDVTVRDPHGNSSNIQQGLENEANGDMAGFITPDQPITPEDPSLSLSSISDLTELTSKENDKEISEAHQSPLTAVEPFATLPHAQPPPTSNPVNEAAAKIVTLPSDGTPAGLMISERPWPVEGRIRRSTNPIKRFGGLVDTTTAVQLESDEDEIMDESEPLHEDSEDSTELDKEEVVEKMEDPYDDDFKTANKRTPRSRNKGKQIDLTMLTDTPSASAKSLKRKRSTKDEPIAGVLSKAKCVKRDSIMVKLRISSDKIAEFSPTEPIKKPPIVKKTPTAKRASKISDLSGLLTPPATQPQFTATISHAGDLDETGLDTRLVSLSRRLIQRQLLHSKPDPQGLPEVWADSRQALCETVPYFKMAQSGCHQNDRHVYAFLFDGIGHPREYTDTDVIIARAGGGMESDASGQMLQKKDHLWSEPQVQAMLNDIEHQNPLIIIAGNRNEMAICKLPHRYNVLGWYKPIAVWAEKSMGKGKSTWTTIKYRFERLDCSTAPWYAPKQELLTADERQSVGPLIRQICVKCQQEFPLAYLNGWMCLNSECEQFWKLPSGVDAPYGKLFYNPAFLLHRTKWANEDEPYSVRPPVPDVGNFVGDNLAYINTRGICCPKCGRCSSRRLFKGWQCDNPACTFTNFPKHLPVKPPMLHNPWEKAGDGPSLSRNKHEKSLGVEVSVTHVHGYKVFTYTFRGVQGRLVHAVSNAKINRQENGPDEMFAAMQRQDDPEMNLYLERRRFAVERGSGGTEMKRASIPASRPVKQRRSVAPHRSLGPYQSVASLHSIAPLQRIAPLQHITPHRSTVVFASPATELGRGSISQMNHTFYGVGAQNKMQADDVEMLRRDYFQSFRQGGLQKSELQQSEPHQSEFQQGEFHQHELQQNEDEDMPDLPEVSRKKREVGEDGDFMTAFSMNYGMPYKFVASGASMPFAKAPWPVKACQADLNWASKKFLDPVGHEELNELLIFAYLEGQKIEYHDDGESGLGPRIATMSLGGKAKMHLRIKMRHHVGCSKSGIFNADRPIPGGIDGDKMYQKRLAAWEELEVLKQSDKRAYEARRKEIPKALGIFEKRTKVAGDLVTITLNHGDIVLMEGYDIQKYLEHKVVPESCLRFALTCRTVLPEHLKLEERPSYDVEPHDPSVSSLYRMEERERAKEVVSSS